MRDGTVPLIGALIVFLIFFANVAYGAYSGSSLLSDVADMLTLATAVALFVIGILLREAHHNSQNQ